MFMAYSWHGAELDPMRTAALVFACVLGAVACAHAGQAELARGPFPIMPPPPGPPPGPPPLPEPPPGVRPYAPLPPPLIAHPRIEVGHPPPRGRECYNQAEAREKIALHRLTDPMRALRVGRLQGEALRARLCRWTPDEFVYEVFVLRRDGRIVHVYMNAQNGEAVGVLNGDIRDKDRK